MDYKGSLMGLVLRLASGELTVPQFREAYYHFYLEKVPDEVMSDRDYRFFGQLQEKLDWTDPSPSDTERIWGWITYEEYVDWVKKRLGEYAAGSDLD